MPVSPAVSLGLHAAGLIVFYSLYGLLQERILKGSYGENGEKFTSAPMLVLCNRLFSMCVGIAIIFYKSASRSFRSDAQPSLLQRLKPASPVYAYSAVALLNFAATFCQYEALKYVGFTTQALAKTIKMVPVLIISTLVYKKTHGSRQWVAGTVVLLGCATYLTSRPDPRAATVEHSFFDGVIGTALLLGYLGLDGLTSTTQEKVFGKNPNPSDPFGDDSPVLDQMVWVNLFASVISAIGAVISFPVTIHSIGLILTNPPLLFDILTLSATAALGLIVLLNTIAAFGALTSSTIMTCRQFLSILINAGVFGNFSSVGLQGWLGVGWVASGIYIKMDRSWDEKKPAQKVVLPVSDQSMKDGAQHSEKASLMADGSPIVDRDQDMEEEEMQRLRKKPALKGPMRYLRQYGPPLLVPIVLAMAFAYAMPMFADQPIAEAVSNNIPADTSYTPDATLFSPSDSNLNSDVQDLRFDTVVTPTDESVELSDDSLSVLPAPSEDNSAVADDYTPETVEDVVVEGGEWSQQLHSKFEGQCSHDLRNTTYFPGDLPFTVLATYPRSGNSYIRSMVERASGYRTSSVYCDHVLAETFLGECSRDGFLRKSHYPANKVRESNINTPDHWKQYDRQVHLVRNPIDAIHSYFHFRHTNHSHTDRIEVEQFGPSEEREVLILARRWADHAEYWERAKLQTHFLRYEDLRTAPLPSLMSLLSFLLPADKLPSLESLACMVELNEEAQAYHSRKNSFFSAWDVYPAALRSRVFEIVQDKWCAYGYDRMLLEVNGERPIDCKGLRETKRSTKRTISSTHDSNSKSKRWSHFAKRFGRSV